MEETKRCTDCKLYKPLTDYYMSPSHAKGVMCYCKSCFNRRAVTRWIKRKKEAIAYMGAKCQRCGLEVSNSHYSVFEFHHTNKSVKENDWSRLRLKSWDAIKEELNKCLLVCANCHRVIHSEDFPDQPGSHE